MSRHYFTFGMGQEFSGRFFVIEAKTADLARHEMFKRFGKKWSWQYTETEFLPMLDEGGTLSHYTELTEKELRLIRKAKVTPVPVKPAPEKLAKLPMMITSAQAASVIETREPLGKFIHPSNGIFVGIDNETGEAWTEEFTEFRDALKWQAQN